MALPFGWHDLLIDGVLDTLRLWHCHTMLYVTSAAQCAEQSAERDGASYELLDPAMTVQSGVASGIARAHPAALC